MMRLKEISSLIRFDRLLPTCTALVLLLLPAACSGGGGSSSGSGGTVLPPGATPTPISTSSNPVTSLADCTRSSSTLATARHTLSSIPASAVTAVPTTTYTLTSYPTGASITNNGSAIGSAPVSFTPIYSSSANFLTFTSGSSSYTLCLTQSGYPSRTILYNASGDTSGSITAISTTSAVRAPLSKALSAAQNSLPANLVHHALRQALNSDVIPDALLVKYKSSVLQSENRSIQSIESGVGVSSARSLGLQTGATLSRVVRFPKSTSAASLMQQLSHDSAVDSVYRVHYRSTLSVSPITPNDPEFTIDDVHQWDLYQIQAPFAWGITEGSPSVAIAIVDTGYDPNNNDLAGKVKFSESIIQGVTTTGSAAAQDTDGHGTNVSGIAAADTNNGISVSGTGYNVSLQEYRIFPNPSDPGYFSSAGASSADEAQGIYDAVANGAKVISLSIGGVASGGIDQAEYDAVEYAISQGVTVAAAAGNERLSGANPLVNTVVDNTVDFPAAYPGVIGVGATSLNDTAAPGVRTSATEYVTPYSNSGPGLALVAPGGDPTTKRDSDLLHWIVNLDTTQPACTDPSTCSRCSSLTNCLALFAGTSQATPHVSGAAALMYSLNPSLSPAQVRSILMANADNINDPRQGAGRLNMYRALAAVAGVAPPTAPAYTNFVAFGYTNSGGTRPTIVDTTFTGGVPLNSDGTFRLPDINPSVGTYQVAVWADTNGDGIVDAGDYFGVGSTACQATSPCTASATGITVGPVSSGFTLP